MYKLWASIYKEFLLLTRDLGGLTILFVMPLVLIITITLIQDSSFKSIQESKIPILIVDNDKGMISSTIFKGLRNQKLFEVIVKEKESEVEELVFKGTYQLAIVIPENLSRDLALKISQNVEGVLSDFGMEDKDTSATNIEIPTKEVRLYFDPAIRQSFKSSIKSGIDKMISKIETESIYKAFQEQLLDDDSSFTFNSEKLITFNEITPKLKENDVLPNSAQHNVPAWTLFAIFFIIVPLSINMVKEKSQGTFVRLRTNPVSYSIVLAGKTVVFLMVCLIQFFLMVLIGVYLFPVLGLPTLAVSGKLFLAFLVALFSGLAAVGLGLLLGTVAKSQEQAAPFGATFVVVLAALGGVWVPVFMMPNFMQFISNLSPMNWGLNAFYDVFLRNGGLLEILPEIGLLFLFFLATTIISIIYNNKKNAV
ncbi:MAG: ABC transporter permease [Flavobacteriaceae bacterium]|jgi:ABC-2 type transport system permease protein|nr:ABC transporter permease [Flavobacteriaceae bacterium]|tara:strand:+ start:11373 stop:12641 length:1269 start_codon:yes stop_codon:yes gene_type:complete